MNYIDLSVEVNEGTAVYPGDPSVKLKQEDAINRDGFSNHTLSISTHVGTHIDAPSHMIDDAKNIGAYDVSKFVGRGVLIDVREGYDLVELKKASIKQGDIVLLWTGMIEHYSDPNVYFEEYPEIPLEYASYLASKRPDIVGMDMCSPDKAPFDVHKLFLGSDILILENVANLSQLQNKSFEVAAWPLKLNVDGAPVRVVAMTEEL